ncbi:DNA cytosine methyltransferase [Streptobacillus moniliformis]|uniref:DNA cytosine methyltransferase n=1 Tax=Streptobacillus moniliformis TaxID=34105 RepID=UPI000A6ABA9E|nr:DNA cytosine methyltransferase [Streptobacillus moniliformis]
MIEVKNKSLAGLKFIDLFAGLGGFRLSLESFGAECVYSNEWDKNAQKVYQMNFGDMPEGDITLIDENNIPDHDILCAGFPCQAFSISGKQKGFEDNRGTLFFDVARIIKAKNPKVVFMENVKNFASHDNGNTLKIVQNTMIDLGYDFYYDILNSLDFGIPQKRERIYMVCFRKDLNIKNFIFPKPFIYICRRFIIT